jgi:hypothetical protein
MRLLTVILYKGTKRYNMNHRHICLHLDNLPIKYGAGIARWV